MVSCGRSLQNNKLSGQIPASLGLIPTLQELYEHFHLNFYLENMIFLSTFSIFSKLIFQIDWSLQVLWFGHCKRKFTKISSIRSSSIEISAKSTATYTVLGGALLQISSKQQLHRKRPHIFEENEFNIRVSIILCTQADSIC